MTDKNSNPDNPKRRSFIKTSASIALAGIGSSLVASKATASELDSDWIPGLSHSQSDRLFWQKVKRQFLLDKRTTYMNIGTTGSMPKHVLADYHDNNKTVAKYPWDMDGKFGSWPYVSEMVTDIAAGFGADPHEIILSRNTTDGMCSIINGLHFQPGDVILTTHHEHVAGTSPLNVVKQRFEVEVVEVQLPVYTGSEAVSDDDYVDAFAEALNNYDNVRLVVFSHITYKTGAKLPAKRLCELAKNYKVPTLVDGAHTIGMLDLDFHDLDCDFYAGSGHKWQCGPGGTGILYVRDDAKRLDQYWYDRPNPLWLINSSLSHADYLGKQLQMQYIGNDNYPAKQALADSCKMWDDIGRAKIEERVLYLGSLCKLLLAEALPSAYVFSPNVESLSSGLTTFNPFGLEDGEKLTEFRDRLRNEYGYIIRTTSFKLYQDDAADSHALRISTHLFHDETDVEGLVKAIKNLYQDMS
ncbi:aminotransferase class V-fold PLP-dependent enzyme [Photobacterium sanctipauli]|uniref:Aminotransferase class V-fold PLP-dependent enzyme n=1 Tax=Photobacterium sanctipauli TaxID=1342794 RepID=A0A2T3NVL6_9GAMM|nr:aminotransferase class V-fold PLP-dependent enzyme [Photobacterium sanctipauli]PSW20316.1 aminotransferase class V-fold PLP-dependent enzyme [Photobacterium sanctipauli]